ncbi:MAG: DUF4347 domain-containing protein [Chlorobiaceae bacterium]|nr:DUF4347 domain-containing protein [Chlorobiaceae bacterium]
MAKSRVFIDSRVNDTAFLIAQSAPGTEYLVLDENLDGIGQIVAALSGQSDYDSIQIISHGSSGSITLGSSELNSTLLDRYAGELALIGNALTESGDLLLYGCNVAAGEAGQQFIQTLSRLTGADVAASDDATGGASAGGDWVLEVQSGPVGQSMTIDVPAYDNLLANTIPTVSAPLVKKVAEGASSASLNLFANANDPDAGDKLYLGPVSYTVNGVSSILPTGFTLNGKTLTVDPANTVFNSLAPGQSKILVATYQVLDRAASGTISFAAKADYSTGSFPDSVTSADINGDGKSDLIVANNWSNTVSVLSNNGDGTFAAKVDYSTGSFPASVTSADVNGDGKSDLIVANNWSNTVSVLSNNGDGTFAAKVDYSTGSFPDSVTSADVNGDGKADLIVANNWSNTVSVLRNSGDGTFAAKADYSTGSFPDSVTSADVNGDGKADLIVANKWSNTVSVLSNNGDGTFAAKVDYSTGSFPASVTSAYVNGDGKADLIVANRNSNTVSVLRNKGDGIFAAKVDYSTGSFPDSVISADVNGDGKSDLIVANNGSNTVSVLRNKGDGTFAARVDFATGLLPNSVISADVTGDGKSDIIVANYYSNTVSVLKNTSTAISGYPTTTATITINGKNDTPVVTNSVEARQGSVTESGFGVAGSASATGTLTASDVDAGATKTWSIVGSTPENACGGITIDATSGVWDYTLDNNDTVTQALKAGESVLQSYTARVTDEFGAYADQTIAITISGSNDAPTLTSFSDPVDQTTRNKQEAISLAELLAKGDEADADGTVDAMVIESVTSGTLLIGADAASATSFNTTTNNTVDALHQAFWTPSLDTYGLLDAFTTVAKDNAGIESATPVQVKVDVLASMVGSTGNDQQNGAAGDDQMYGEAGNDTLMGNGGNDLLDGGTDADRMEGGAGNDMYVVDNPGDVVKETAGKGTDSVEASITFTLVANVENLTLTGSGAINGKGNVLDNVINGNDGANVLSGATGNDTILGVGGNDTINGGTGADVMTGGDGNDLFVFDYLATTESGVVATSHDIITDFVSGQDRLDLSAIDANARINGNQVFDSTIISATNPFTAAGQLRFDGATGMLYGNTDNNLLTAEFTIQLTGVSTLLKSDMIF